MRCAPLVFVFVLGIAAAACGSRTPLDPGDSTSTGLAADDGGAPPSGGEGPDGWPAGSCAGPCARPPLAPRAFAGAADAARAMRGRWGACANATDAYAGEELAADGSYFRLVVDATGGKLVRDPTSRGTWRIDKMYSDGSAYLAVASSGGTLYRRAYLQDCPRNLWLDGDILDAVP